LLKSAPVPQPATPKDALKLKAYFYNKVADLRVVEKGETRVEKARQKSGISKDALVALPSTAPTSGIGGDKGSSEGGGRGGGGKTSAYSSVHAKDVVAEDLTSDSSVSDPDSDEGEFALSPAAQPLFSTDSSPAPKFKTYWDKMAASPVAEDVSSSHESGIAASPSAPGRPRHAR